MPPEKPRRLGKGLEALIGSSFSAPLAQDAPINPGSELQRIPLVQIQPNPFQPRREFPEAEIAELAASLKASGILQPVVVRRARNGFELVSGERRFRAATRLGWHEIPAIVREADDRTMLTLALIENLQRSDLNVVEEARGYQRLQEQFQLTQQEIAEAVGKDRSTVANLLRLLTLPNTVVQMLGAGHITMGHARALLSLSDQQTLAALAAEIVARQLSVREVERRVRTASQKPAKAGSPKTSPREVKAEIANPPAVKRIEDALRRHFQTDVRIQLSSATAGAMEISFYTTEDMERLLDLILGASRSMS